MKYIRSIQYPFFKMAPRKISKSTISAPVATTVTATAYQFHLPALDIPQTSLTEGTLIPSPQRDPSPPISPPQTPLSIDSPNPLRSHPTSSHSLSRKASGDVASTLNGYNRAITPRSTDTQTHSSSTMANSNVKRSFTASPASPQAPPSKRPHIRKLLSLKSLANLNRSSADLSRLSNGSETGYSVNIRSQSPSPSTNISTGVLTQTKRRGSSTFWRRNSAFGIGLGLVKEENDNRPGHVSRTHSSPPMLPEFEGMGHEPEMQITDNTQTTPQIRKQPSGWFGGENMFDGIGKR